MSRLQWILAGIVAVTWLPSYVWFFRKDMQQWLAARAERRAAAREASAAKAKMLDELAARYLPPQTGGG